MPLRMWHCPHCGAPQAETARCWVCRRSSTTCSTCIHFRRSLAGDLGYCALDPRKLPLTGRELRGCWEGRAAAQAPVDVPAPEAHRLRPGPGARLGSSPGLIDAVPARGFVPVEHLAREFVPVDLVEREAESSAAVAPPSFVIPEPDEDWSARTSLFGDAEA